MKVVALVSGGKDSCFAMMQCVQYGHEIVALANLMPADDSVDELDSYMYQTVGHQIVTSYAKCMGVPLFRRRIQGSTRDMRLGYSATPGDEVEDMFILLNEVKRQIPSITAVSSGAIASDYQRLRVESVCSRLGLVSLAYLWKQDQPVLLQEMIKSGIVAITVKVAAIGLDPSKHLGKEIAFLESHLHKLKGLYGINVCGEGGEYETLTLDCPLFKNARIVLDEFQVLLHSSDAIAPVGILHPLEFHLESKQGTVSLIDSNRSSDECATETSSVCEVLGDCLQEYKSKCQDVNAASDSSKVKDHKLHISKTNNNDSFSISCCLQDSCENSADLEEDLKIVLMKIELQLMECGYSWEDVLYIHLYIDDMNKFAVANETYVKYITIEKCQAGVPSRCTIELPLLQVGLGAAYIEVLVANDRSKKVLHVQSISSWAPSCIGPYSQATLHKEILHMAGQLGLDPPTMLLHNGGPTAELDQALENCEAVAQYFNCSIATSAILFVIYCSASINTSDRMGIQDRLEVFLKRVNLDNGNMPNILEPIFLYVLAPDLPKRACVEVKPVLFAAESVETATDHDKQDLTFDTVQSFCGFGHESWDNSFIQKCIVQGKIFVAVTSITDDVALKICPESTGTNEVGVHYKSRLSEMQMEKVAKFCIYRLNTILLENHFSWEDIMNLRLYYSTSLQMSHGTLSTIFTCAFNEFAETSSKRFKINKELPIFNLVPVLGAGRSATSMDDIITCEAFARRS